MIHGKRKRERERERGRERVIDRVSGENYEEIQINNLLFEKKAIVYLLFKSDQVVYGKLCTVLAARITDY